MSRRRGVKWVKLFKLQAHTALIESILFLLRAHPSCKFPTTSIIDNLKDCFKFFPFDRAVSISICQADQVRNGAFLRLFPEPLEDFCELVGIKRAIPTRVHF